VLQAWVFGGLLLSLMAAAAWRQSRARAMRAYAAGIRQRHDLQALFVSKLADRAFIGVTVGGGGLLLGDEATEKVWPFSGVRGVEVLHIRSGGERLKSLIVRVTVEDESRPHHDYVIFDWPNGWGPRESQKHVKAMIDQAERIRALVSGGMDRAA
jgi:hypothetical protein